MSIANLLVPNNYNLYTNNLNVGGNEIVTGDLTVDGSLTVNGGETITGNFNVNGNLNVTGNETLGGNLTVTGNETVNGSLTVNTNLIVNGNQLPHPINSASYIPTLTADEPTVTNLVNLFSYYYQLGNQVFGYVKFGYTDPGSLAGTQTFSVTIPVPRSVGGNFTNEAQIQGLCSEATYSGNNILSSFCGSCGAIIASQKIILAFPTVGGSSPIPVKVSLTFNYQI